jgi:GTP cyclohydrolase II/3,4-dihydroxy 2-butanone 4-phosphate synthase/GTP cyclohydrolase II
MASPTPASPFARYSEADLPTEYGDFRVIVYREQGPAVTSLADARAHRAVEHLAIVHGDVRGGDAILTRVHSECLTGEVLHSLKCDCREQLDLAFRRVVEAGRGVVVYLRQEGRGIGLGNKILAYEKQGEGYDTVDANRVLGFEDDLRTYDVAAFMLADLGVRSIELLTNNPAKVEGLAGEGVCILRRLDHHVKPHGHNRDYLAAKRRRMGHLYELDSGDERLPDDVELEDAAANE